MVGVSLEEIVSERSGQRIGEAGLLEIWQSVCADLGLPASEGEQAVLVTARDATALALDELQPAFGGAWEWDLTDSVMKTLVVSAILTGVLSAAGVKEMAPIVIPTVLPLLFDIKRVRLERKAERIIRIVGARPEAFNRTGTRADLYKSLPDEVREYLSLHEFSEFIEDALTTGDAKESQGIIEVLPNGETALNLTIRRAGRVE